MEGSPKGSRHTEREAPGFWGVGGKYWDVYRLHLALFVIVLYLGFCCGGLWDLFRFGVLSLETEPHYVVDLADLELTV